MGNFICVLDQKEHPCIRDEEIIDSKVWVLAVRKVVFGDELEGWLGRIELDASTNSNIRNLLHCEIFE